MVFISRKKVKSIYIIEKVKSEENIITLVDWNATVVEENEDCIVGRYGLGERNGRGDRLIEFCAKNKLVITNTLFRHHGRRRYTWKALGNIRRDK